MWPIGDVWRFDGSERGTLGQLPRVRLRPFDLELGRDVLLKDGVAELLRPFAFLALLDG